ncbi:enoyl-CoA hydratase/isomerase family protein [Streptomyces iconiensis]|uniref:Enoyl-CoA hydratase/isomerase family protein n=1 Tax=Streptomyces iconiensis TaxID=1384038 RepID=A0ABT6ZZ54_9ACTN|nr:enoyl-CoA hydratase/isomerase family protein [Streptomyces iconiensis]MDJ1134360.1 enoyl-CoA hydratase/isomerase family protein [Streptomyces iconiensis]
MNATDSTHSGTTGGTDSGTGATGGADASGTVLLSHEGPVAVVTLNRPEKLNAWTAAMRSRLIDLLRQAAEDPEVTAIVLTGAGRAFCAGQDLGETTDIAPDDHAAAEAWIDSFDALYRAVRDIDKPTVAAVNGVVAGSGFQFALLPDLRIGHAGVRMGQPELLSGIPSITGIWAMWEILGRAKTTEFAMTGELVDGEEARRLGLLTRLVEPDQVLHAAVEQARKLGELPPGAVALTKARIRELDEAALVESVEAAKKVHTAAYATGEPQREMARFLAGRRR